MVQSIHSNTALFQQHYTWISFFQSLLSRCRLSLQCWMLAPEHLLPYVFQLSEQGAWFSEETQTPMDSHEDYFPSGNKSWKTLSSILNVTIFQYNLSSTCDPGIQNLFLTYFYNQTQQYNGYFEKWAGEKILMDTADN